MKTLLSRRTLYSLACLVLIAFAAWLQQASLFLNYDNSYLLQAARLMLGGGTYTQDFFTPNSPTILFLYSPVVLLSQAFGLNALLVFRCYLFSLIFLSLGLCYYLLRSPFLMLVLAVLLFLFPTMFFGQREHLLLILSFPYLLLVASRLTGKEPPRGMAALIGLMAGLGFCIKPYFLLLPVFVEAYYLFSKRKLSALFRIESLSIFAVCVGTLCLSALFFADYFSLVLPYVLRNYHQAMHSPLSSLAFSRDAYYCYFSILLCLLVGRSKPLSGVILMALLAGLGVDFLQQSIIFYHRLPYLALAAFLCAGLGGLNPGFSIRATVLVVLGLGYPFFWSQHFYMVGASYKKELLNPLIQWVKKQPAPVTLYAFSMDGYYALPLSDYTGSVQKGRMDCFWPMYFVLQNNYKPEDEAFFISMVTEDLHRSKPEYVLSAKDRLPYRQGWLEIDYPAYFSKSPAFKKEWKAYHYLTTLKGERPYYRLDIYKREAKES